MSMVRIGILVDDRRSRCGPCEVLVVHPNHTRSEEHGKEARQIDVAIEGDLGEM